MDDSVPGQDYAARLIKFKARQMSRRPGFTGADREDLEQDLWADLLDHLPRYDPARASLPTFIARVVECKAASMLRHHFAEMRTPERVEASLNEPVRNSDGQVVERHETTPEVAQDAGHLLDLQRDVANVMSTLSDELRAVALALAEGTPNRAATEVGLSRRAVPKAIEQLREIFRDAELDKYL